MKATKRGLFTDEKVFYTNANRQQEYWSSITGERLAFAASRLLVECVVVSAGVRFKGRRLHFIEERVGINANYCVDDLLPKLVKARHDFPRNSSTFQRAGIQGLGDTQECIGRVSRFHLQRIVAATQS